jgi:iron complex transport system substrate-binding protein
VGKAVQIGRGPATVSGENYAASQAPAHAAETRAFREKERSRFAPGFLVGLFFTEHAVSRQGRILKSRMYGSVAQIVLACVLLSTATRAQTPTAQSLPGSPASPLAPAVPAFREVKDDMGRSVRVPQTISRIVSLAPNLTETIYALGLQDHLVGDTDQCDYPLDAKKIPKVGGVINPSIEEVISLHPDLVLVAAVNRFETVRALDDLNIPVYETDPHTVEEIVASTTKLADVLGAPQNGVTLAAELQQRLTDLQTRLADQTARRVLFVVWTDPLISIGKSTFIADALKKAGALSIVESAQDWPHLSLEEVVRLQPEYLIFTSENDEKAPDQSALALLPGWRSLEAVKNHKFATISDAIDRPAPRLVSAIEDLAHQLHAGAFTPKTPAGELAAPALEKSRKDNPAAGNNTVLMPESTLSSSDERALRTQEVSCNR